MGVGKVNKGFTLPGRAIREMFKSLHEVAAQARPAALQSKFIGDGQGGSTSRPGETLGGFLFCAFSPAVLDGDRAPSARRHRTRGA
ncbi:protein of unknown function [Aminobacter niigataensis]|nr:protein of unknown function [Aminobacter niigataensis]